MAKFNSAAQSVGRARLIEHLEDIDASLCAWRYTLHLRGFEVSEFCDQHVFEANRALEAICSFADNDLYPALEECNLAHAPHVEQAFTQLTGFIHLTSSGLDSLACSGDTNAPPTLSRHQIGRLLQQAQRALGHLQTAVKNASPEAPQQRT